MFTTLFFLNLNPLSEKTLAYQNSRQMAKRKTTLQKGRKNAIRDKKKDKGRQLHKRHKGRQKDTKDDKKDAKVDNKVNKEQERSSVCLSSGFQLIITKVDKTNLSLRLHGCPNKPGNSVTNIVFINNSLI